MSRLRALFRRYFSRLIKDVSTVFLIQVSALALGYILNIVIARTVGVADYGDYVFATSWAFLLPIFGGLGFTVSILKFLPVYMKSEKWSRVKGILLAFNLTTFAGTALLALIVWLIISQTAAADVSLPVLAVGLSIAPFIALRDLNEETLRGLQRVILAFGPSRILQPVTVIVLVAIIWFTGELDSLQAISALFVSLLLVVVVQMVALWKTLPASVLQASPSFTLNTWLSISMPLLVFKGAIVIVERSDILVIGFLMDSSAAGIYGAASKIAGLTIFALTAVNAIIVPRIAPLYENNEHEKLQQLVRTASRLSFVGSLVIFSGLVVFSGFLLRVFGDEFVVGQTPLLLLGMALVINSTMGPVGYLLAMTNYQRILTLIFVTSAAVNIGLNLLLIPLMGLEGAAIATIISQLLTAVWSYLTVRHYLKLDAAPFTLSDVGALFRRLRPGLAQPTKGDTSL